MFPIIKVEIEDFQKQDWVSIYQSGLTELEHARISGRIEAAQKAIVSRMEKLLTMPGLHPEERHANEDAIRILGILEQEEARYDSEQKRLAVGSLLEKLRSVGFTDNPRSATTEQNCHGAIDQRSKRVMACFRQLPSQPVENSALQSDAVIRILGCLVP